MNEGFHRGAREGGADRPGGVAGAPRSPRAPGGWRPRCRGTQVSRRGTTHQAEGPPVALGPVRSALAGPEPNTVHFQRWKETGLRSVWRKPGRRGPGLLPLQDLEGALTFKIGVFCNSGTRCRLSK